MLNVFTLVNGRLAIDGNLEPGRRILAWDGRDDAGRAVPNGVYFLIGRSDDQTSRLKLAVLR